MQLVPFGKAISIPAKPRLRLFYSLSFQVFAITWISTANNKRCKII